MILSVIVPVYNTPREFLEHCISSIKDNLHFFLNEVEVLLINDGSTKPYIQEILKLAEKEDPRFRYVYKPNSGVSNTRNLGIQMAQGNYIMFIDADDYLEPDAIRYMLNVAQARDEDMLMFGYCNDDDDVERKELKRQFVVDKTVIWSLVSNCMESWCDYGTYLAYVWARLYKREALLRSGVLFLQDLSPLEDGFFNLCFLHETKCFYVDNRLVYHYVTNHESAIHVFSDCYFRVAKNIIPRLDAFVDANYKDCPEFVTAVDLRVLTFVMILKERYFTHPQNTKSFWELKTEMHDFLSIPFIKKHIGNLRLSNVKKKNEKKNIILLKLRLYWIFLLTERRKRIARER